MNRLTVVGKPVFCCNYKKAYQEVLGKYMKRESSVLKWMIRVLRICMCAVIFSGVFTLSAYADEPFVIVIDPGHGGENLGAQYDGYTEKDMTMTMALAMKEELEKFDNIVVYLTREDDVDMSIKERARFAAEVKADYLFCLHLNASVHHNLYGAEVWIPSEGEYYAKGFAFAEILMAQFEDMGIYSRGIKTKLNDSGTDYYGILRYCSLKEIRVPAVLIEHCHLDNENDKVFYQENEEQLKEFGRQDALAVAKFLGLSSLETGADYRDYQVPEILIPEGRVLPDKSAPEVCNIEISELDKETGEVTLSIEAYDPDSYILYCNYSLDGGKTYSPLLKWPRPVWNSSEKEHSITVTLPFDEEIELRIKAYNGFDVWTESKSVFIAAIQDPAVKKAKQKAAEELYKQRAYEEISLLDNGKTVQTPVWPVIICIAVIVLLMLIMVLFLTRNIFRLIEHRSKP